MIKTNLVERVDLNLTCANVTQISLCVHPQVIRHTQPAKQTTKPTLVHSTVGY